MCVFNEYVSEISARIFKPVFKGKALTALRVFVYFWGGVSFPVRFITESIL